MSQYYAFIKFTRFFKLIFIISVIFTTMHNIKDVFALDSPYPPSPIVSDIVWNFSSHIEKASGSDNWPITWADDNHQYTSWGDGGGFGGSNTSGRVSLGVARIEGSSTSYKGFNVWGGKSPENPAQFGGKSYGILSIDGILYMWLRQMDSTHAKLAMSTDHGATWTKANWDFPPSLNLVSGTFLNYGRDYAGARDNYVYSYFIHADVGSFKVFKPGQIDLARVPKDQIMNKNAYEFFVELDRNGNPVWTSNLSARKPVFEDLNGVGWTVSVSYNAGLKRYLLSTEHTDTFDGNLGIFDAPEPWGPWTTVGYYDNWGGFSSAFFWNFSNKWLSADGKDFTIIFTGIGSSDSWNTVKGSFVVSAVSDPTPPSTPQNLNAAAQSENQIDLSWQGANDTESGISNYKIYRDSVNVGQSTTTSFSDTELSEGTTYAYEVSAVNGAGLEGIKSTSVSETTFLDTTPPTIISATASSDPTQVIVALSEAVEQTSATSVANYNIDNSIIISSATLSSDLKTVTLTTSPHTEGLSYTLTINNVKDQASVPNVIAPNTTKNYTFVSQLVISNLAVASNKQYEVVQSGIHNGELAYIDRTYIYSNVPALVEGALYIKTANDDKVSSGNSFLSFDVNQDVKVYVAHANKITAKPSWLTSFVDTGEDVNITNVSFSLFVKGFQAGEITLGGNEGSGPMYTVMIVGQETGSAPDTTPPPPPTGLFLMP